MEIILIRHGRPKGAINPRVSASGFLKWIRAYDKSKVHKASVPPTALRDKIKQHFIISSNMPRAIHSTILCLGVEPILQLDVLNEMEIPWYRLPFKAKAYFWLYLNRVLWLAGVKGKFESFQEAKNRSKNAAKILHKLAEKHHKLAVFGHVLSNNYVAKELIRMGWQGKAKHTKYWGAVSLQIPD